MNMIPKSQNPGVSLLLLAFATVLAGSTAVAQTTANRAELPQVKVGDRWKYETKDRRTGVKQSETDRRVTSVAALQIEGTDNGGKLIMTPELNTIDSPTIATVGDAKLLSFPLEVGKKWEFKYTLTNKVRAMQIRRQIDAEVVSYERVTVPAGEFDAYKIQYRGYWNNDTARMNGSMKMTNWYAPAARSIVKNEYEDGFSYSVLELMEFQLQP